jgi:hypothetical protein
VSRTIAAVLLLLLTGGTAQAQGPLVKYGKWLVVAGSIAMNYQAVLSHNNAEDAFDTLEAECNANHALCTVGSDGQYTSPHIEALYQTSLHYDQQARRWLIGGELALAGAAALFIWELTRPKGRPDNIPFEPEVRSMRGGGTGVGLRFAF